MRVGTDIYSEEPVLAAWSPLKKPCQSKGEIVRNTVSM
jgi:hypothetical protein